MAKRLEELDSLRGLAALSVVFHHFLIILPVVFEDRSAMRLLKYTPLHIFWSGHEAVILFFVLSGFVLSMPFISKNNVQYTSFLAKRICRIYIPYLAALGAGILALSIVDHREIDGLSAWVNRIWQEPLNAQVIWSHILLIGMVNNDAIDPVIWSLVHEMRISLFFPLLMLPVVRFGWRTNLLIAAVLAFSGFMVQYLVSQYAEHWNDFGMSIQYSALFIIGGLLAKHRTVLSQCFQAMARQHKSMLGILAVMLYTYPWWFMHDVKLLHRPIIDDAVVGAGASIMVVIALTPGIVSGILTCRAAVYLGRVSYSLYLYHAIVLLACLHLLYGSIPVWAIWPISFVLTIAVSTLAYYATEIPSINAGRVLAKMCSHRANKGKKR